jgi:Flp pilus assembly protein TadD
MGLSENHLSEGDFSRAKSCVNNALRLFPDDRNAKNLLEKIEAEELAWQEAGAGVEEDDDYW